MLKPIVVGLLYFFMPFAGYFQMASGSGQDAPKGQTGSLEKLIVSQGTVSMAVDLGRLNEVRSRPKTPELSELRFDAAPDSFFTIMVFDGQFRDALPSALPILSQYTPDLPAKLRASFEQLVIERSYPGEQYELVVRDGKTGFPFFNIEGHQVNYDPDARVLRIDGGRLLISNDFAEAMRRPNEAGVIVGKISISVEMRPVEVTKLVDGEIVSDVMPALSANAGSVPGPDVVVGDVYGLAQFGSDGSKVGLALGTVSCNYGTENLNWFALPDNDHPVIPQNLYRLSGGPTNDAKLEQIGQSNVKHAFTALTQNLCALGCNGVGGSRLGSGCSDPYSASLNSGPNLGSRAWINPFDGAYPRGDSVTPPNSHSAHSHTSVSHRILTEVSDLNTSLNSGATYYAEGQYITPHEYAWCQDHPGECNMYNNVSYRQYSVTGTTGPFSFAAIGSTVREKPAIYAWPGATIVPIEPDPGNDGVAAIVYKVTSPSAGVWHYEYAIYNQNLDRAIQSFSVPVGAGVVLSNIGFHMPPQHPGWAADGTMGDAGFSSAPWTQTLTASEMKWNSETLAQNPNANAIRWGTMYNFRFDSNSPPEMMNATIGFFKTGAPIVAPVMVPSGGAVSAFSVSGRVTNSNGRPIYRAWVELTDTGGAVRGVFTNPFGRYRITGITQGSGYTIEPYSKGYSFNPQMINVNGNLTGIDFVASP